MSHFDAAWALTTGTWLGVAYCWYRYGKAVGYSKAKDEQLEDSIKEWLE